MKHLVDYIYEAIKQLPKNITGLIVFDIDDTLLRVDPNIIKVLKHPNGDVSKTIPLTSKEFAKDPDAIDHKDWFDFSEFQNPIKVYDSIISGTPLLKNLKILDAYVNAGYDFCFLTARGCEEVVKKALDDFLMVRSNNGQLVKIGDKFKKTLSHAINDLQKVYPGRNDAEKKSKVLQDLCKKYDRVIFVDDDKKNVRIARDMKLDNLTVINAWAE